MTKALAVAGLAALANAALALPTITLSTDKPAFSVWVEAFGIPGEFSDNHFTLLPGEPRTLRFKPRDPSATSSDFARSLIVNHIANTFFHKP